MQENIPSSFIGYNKNTVKQILNQKNQLLKTQKEDIDYLRQENLKLKKQVKKNNDIEVEK